MTVAQFKARGIRVNAVSPGPVETRILKQFRSVVGDAKVGSDIARVGRAGTAADLAQTILFLCSDVARWINGTNIPTDGGLEAAITARHDPVTGEIATVAAAASVVDALKAVDAAAKAFPAWAALGPTERRKLLNKAADLQTLRPPNSSRRASPRPGPLAHGSAST